MNERETIDRGWFYVVEPDDGAHAPADDRIRADDGRVLTRRLHGWPVRAELVDLGGHAAATHLRAVAAVGRVCEARGWLDAAVRIVLSDGGEPTVRRAEDGRTEVVLDGDWVAAQPAPHPVDTLVDTLLTEPPSTAIVRPDPAGLPDRAAPRALFFESLMNTDMPHNDKEISQGVLHLVAPLKDSGTEVVLVNVKMPIEGDERPVWGLDRLRAALAEGPVHLVGITLLEGYWDGVCKLIATLRDEGCRAHIAVGGVMPSLAPEHVAAHLPEVSFVCRGAGECFVPQLARIVGTSTVDDAFTPAQRDALLHLDGLLALDRAGGALLSARSDRTAQVPDLDRVPLDLSHLHPHHIEGGIEISTSRGCIYRCSFCSILGRESYQARSAGSIFDVLGDYEARFRELFGDHIPENSYRVHVSDDDFACDRDRARTFFSQLLDTPFRLSSAQVAVGDLCRREGGRLLAEPDHELLDAMKAECFADHARPIPKTDFFLDHKDRDWSSFLQIGVETYDDREIARLGKGYKRIHIRTVVGELARRGLHMDGYFILSNADTAPEDLVAVFTEVSRLKLRFPEHFHMRFPVVQHLVSYFTAASHRRHVRRGRAHLMQLRGEARVPSHPEFDYPFVDHDEPADAWVGRTVSRRFVTDTGLYTGNLTALAAMWRQWLAEDDVDDERATRMRRLIRILDDRPRRLVFDMLAQAWSDDDDPAWPCAHLDRDMALQSAVRVLGDPAAWMPMLRASLRERGPRRLVVVPTGASPAVLDQAAELLLATDRAVATLHLLPTGPFDLDAVLEMVAEARTRAAIRTPARGAVDLTVTLDAHGWEATPEVAARLAELGVEVQAVLRAPGTDLPDLSPLHAAGVWTRVVLQIPLDAAADQRASWAAVRRAGPSEVAIEPLPEGWAADDATSLARALHAQAGWLRNGDTVLRAPTAAVGSGHLVDVLVAPDGTLGRADGLQPDRGFRASHRLGHLDDLTNVDRHALELHDPLKLSGVPPVDRVQARAAAAQQVIARFVDWLQAPGDSDVDARHAR